MADNQMALKKEKKSKSRQESSEDVQEASASLPSDILEQKKLKKQKKSKKKTEEETEPVEVAVVEEIVEVNKEEKKKKKRKNVEPDVEITTVEVRAEEKPKKKKKKESNGTEEISLGNYIIHPDVENMSSSAAESYRESLGLTMTPPESANLYKPITAFNQLAPSLEAYCPEVLSYLEMKKFPQPSPIQVIFPPPLLVPHSMC
jgi:hypothetical protein